MLNTRVDFLRLRIVKGQSDELISAIVVRGINNPHIKPSATYCNLKPCELVNYLSTFLKPLLNKPEKPSSSDRCIIVKPHVGKGYLSNIPIKCFSCGLMGDKQVNSWATIKLTVAPSSSL